MIPMTLWLPDFGSKEMIETTLESEGIEFEYASDNIIICQADADLYEYLQKNCRKVIPAITDKPSVEVKMVEGIVDIDELPDCIEDVIPDSADAAAAAAEAIEKELEAQIEKSTDDFTSETEEKRSLVENIYRVMHNRKMLSVQLSDVTIYKKDGTHMSISSVARIKGKTNEVSFTCVKPKGRKGDTFTKDFPSNVIIENDAITPKTLRTILKQVNHFK